MSLGRVVLAITWKYTRSNAFYINTFLNEHPEFKIILSMNLIARTLILFYTNKTSNHTNLSSIKYLMLSKLDTNFAPFKLIQI